MVHLAGTLLPEASVMWTLLSTDLSFQGHDKSSLEPNSSPFWLLS